MGCSGGFRPGFAADCLCIWKDSYASEKTGLFRVLRQLLFINLVTNLDLNEDPDIVLFSAMPNDHIQRKRAGFLFRICVAE
jgi:hypothetical protein